MDLTKASFNSKSVRVYLTHLDQKSVIFYISNMRDSCPCGFDFFCL